MMKQMMALEQEKRVQMHMLEQQKLFREQRQQQQQQLLAEQVRAHPARNMPSHMAYVGGGGLSLRAESTRHVVPLICGNVLPGFTRFRPLH